MHNQTPRGVGKTTFGSLVSYAINSVKYTVYQTKGIIKLHDKLF